MSAEREVVGKMVVSFYKHGEPSFKFEGEVDPQNIWTLGVSLKFAYDTEYMTKRRDEEVKNLAEKKKQIVIENARREKETLIAIEKDRVARESERKASAVVYEAKRKRILLENTKLEITRTLEKVKERDLQDDVKSLEEQLVLTEKAIADLDKPVKKEEPKAPVVAEAKAPEVKK